MEVQTGGACFTLQFDYTQKYPDEPPLMELLECDNIDEDEDIPALMEMLNEQVSAMFNGNYNTQYLNFQFAHSYE